MADDLQGNLQNYKLHLQQVEAALTTDPTNEELLKLKVDLEVVLELTRDLIKTQLLEQKSSEGVLGASATAAADDDDDVTAKLLAAEQPLVEEQVSTKRDWKVGDKCLALWGEDGQYYEATIDDITEDGEEVSVTFDSYKNADVTTMALLREIKPGVKRPVEEGTETKNKKLVVSKQREYQKKKKQKKLQRYKQMEEEREGEKNKWLAFNTKATKKGMIRKSIFASPDNINGRVGIGTCGMSGKPMTEFTSAEKWKKGL